MPPEGHKRADPFARGLGAKNPQLAISQSPTYVDAGMQIFSKLGVPPKGHKLADLFARGLGTRKYGLQVS